MTANSSSCEFLQRLFARGRAHQALVERIEDRFKRQQICGAIVDQQDAGLHCRARRDSLDMSMLPAVSFPYQSHRLMRLASYTDACIGEPLAQIRISSTSCPSSIGLAR